MLPEIEDSASESFRDLPDLAWIADNDSMSTEVHLKYVLKGTSWVVEVDNRVVGFLCAEPTGSDFHIWEVDVQSEWQGKGIGRRLMKTAIKHAHSNEYISVTLTTFIGIPWNEPFYRSLGFERIDKDKIDSRLEDILRAEIQHGLPGNLRCAMRLLVSDHSAQLDRQNI